VAATGGSNRAYTLRHWHADQAVKSTGEPLPRLQDGALSVGQLQAWAREFDALGAGERWTAAEFVDWLELELPAALGVAS
jgi:hypothetical protein